MIICVNNIIIKKKSNNFRRRGIWHFVHIAENK